MPPTRVLAVTESSFAGTGFGTYSGELLARLHADPAFEVMELGCQGGGDDPRAAACPWPYFANEPPAADAPAAAAYRAACDAGHSPRVGAFAFERACLHFKPDAVLTYRDWHDDEWVARSPFRPRFAWAAMATVDAPPQPDAALSTYLSCDATLAYTRWGAGVLHGQSAGRLSPAVASPAADTAVFRPLGEAARRKALAACGLRDSPFVVGACLRNQPRKLLPDLFHAFGLYLGTADARLAARSHLWLHTTYPDCGWDLPALIRDCGFGARVLLTYLCRDCGGCSAAPYRGSRAACRLCGADAAFLPQPAEGVSRHQLAGVMGLFDCLIQLSTNEGFGMPLVEAAACGVPVLAVDHSAMAEVVRDLGGHPIRVERHFRDPGTATDRALPDRLDCAAAVLALATEAEPARLARREAAARLARSGFSYDNAAAAWKGVLGRFAGRGDWAGPPRLAPRLLPAGDCGEFAFARALYHDFLGRPDLAASHATAVLARDVGWGRRGPADASQAGPTVRFSREAALAEVAAAADHADAWERVRAQQCGS
jgi:glycosyltransferase involved in cell wall biosynthesis